MSKAHRGKPLKQETPGSGRGNCPICKRSGIKLLYDHEVNDEKLVLCKQCYAAAKSGRLKKAI